jgi:hypothetical protein
MSGMLPKIKKETTQKKNKNKKKTLQQQLERYNDLKPTCRNRRTYINLLVQQSTRDPT